MMSGNRKMDPSLASHLPVPEPTHRPPRAGRTVVAEDDASVAVPREEGDNLLPAVHVERRRAAAEEDRLLPRAVRKVVDVVLALLEKGARVLRRRFPREDRGRRVLAARRRRAIREGDAAVRHQEVICGAAKRGGAARCALDNDRRVEAGEARLRRELGLRETGRGGQRECGVWGGGGLRRDVRTAFH
jgi:hypothetical protein